LVVGPHLTVDAGCRHKFFVPPQLRNLSALVEDADAISVVYIEKAV
jgi:hypothetical protein